MQQQATASSHEGKSREQQQYPIITATAKSVTLTLKTQLCDGIEGGGGKWEEEGGGGGRG